MNRPPDRVIAAYLWPCEQRTPAESAAKGARANRPRNFHIPPNGSDRGDVLAPRHNRKILRGPTPTEFRSARPTKRRNATTIAATLTPQSGTPPYFVAAHLPFST